MRNQFLPFLLIAVATAVYPLIIYFGLNQLGPRSLAIILLVILVLRAFFWKMFKPTEKIIYLIIVGLVCIFAAWFKSEQLLRYYPVLMNLAVALFFWVSLFGEKTLIDRFASMMEDTSKVHIQRYLRRLTVVWAAILTLNSIVAFYTACCLSLKQWALYNGVIAYVIFGVFSLGELAFRHHYKKAHQEPVTQHR